MKFRRNTHIYRYDRRYRRKIKHIVWSRILLARSFTLAAVVVLLVTSLAPSLRYWGHYRLVDGSGFYGASDTQGEFNAISQSNGPNNTSTPTNPTGMQPSDTLIDTSHHRLFVDDQLNDRVLIYNLDSNNNLTGSTANNVLGQSDLSTNIQEPAFGSAYIGFGNVAQNTVLNSTSLAYDSVNNRLFVGESFMYYNGTQHAYTEKGGRVLIFDLTGGVSDNMNASHVLGQANFTSSVTDGFNEVGEGANNFGGVDGLAYDATHKYLYVSDSAGLNCSGYCDNRIMVFDLSGTISDGMNATYVLGQPNFTNGATYSTSANMMNTPLGLNYDNTNNRLFVTDSANNRVLVFDMSGGVSTFMNASWVIGLPTLTSFSPSQVVSQSSLYQPQNVYYDTGTKILYVSDTGNDRVVTYNLSSGISDGMNASHVLGEPDFNTSNPDPSHVVSQSRLSAPEGLTYDPTNSTLFVSDGPKNHRMMEFNLSSIADGMNASGELGQTDLSGALNYTTSGVNNYDHYANQFTGQVSGTAIDTVHHRLFVGDAGNGRVMIYNLDANNNFTTHTAAYELGQPNFTSSSTNLALAQNVINCPGSLAYDSARQYLFVDDMCADRIMVFDLSGSVTPVANDMNAIHVLGEPDYTTYTSSATQSTFANSYSSGGLVFDPTTKNLFFADNGNYRVLVFNTTALTDGMNASNVIGQTNFQNSNYGVAQNTFNNPMGLAIDPQRNELFVADNYDRVMVFNLCNLADGMNASNVLGEADFTSSNSAADLGSTPDAKSFGATGLSYDTNDQRLLVYDADQSRVLSFDLAAGITDNMNATGVLGGSSFSYQIPNNQATPPSKYLFNISYTSYGSSDAYDPTTNRLYLSDTYDSRVDVFSFANLSSVNSSPSIGTPYNQTLGSQTQGTATYSVTSGTLPTGLTLNGSTGQLSGTVTTYGSYNFTVQLNDNNGALGSFTGTRNYTVNVGGATGGSSGGTSGGFSCSGGGSSGGGGGGSSGGSTGGSGGSGGSSGGGSTSGSSSGGSTAPATQTSAPAPKPHASIAVASAPVSQPTPTPSPTTIQLDQYPAYTHGSGYTSAADTQTTYTVVLPNPSTGSNTTYSLAVQSITPGSNGAQVVLNIAPGGQAVTLDEGHTSYIDVAGSGHNSVGVQLVQITPATGSTPATATLKFWKLASATNRVPVVHAATTSSTPSMFERILNTLTNFIRHMPNQYVDLFPYILFLLLAIEATLLFRQAARELREYRVLQKLLNRARTVDEGKLTFIQLASHYLRTPVTVLTSGLELLAMGKNPAPASVGEMQKITQRINQTAESLVSEAQTVEARTAVGDLEGEADTKHLWRRGIILLPILLNAIVWTVFTYLANRAGKFSFDQVNFAIQVIIFVIVVTMLYLSLRTRQLRRRDRKSAERILANQEAITRAKDTLIANTVTGLQDDLKRLDVLVATVGESPAAKPLQSGSQSLHDLLNKFIIAKNLHGSFSKLPAAPTSLDALLNHAKAGVSELTAQKDISITTDTDTQVNVREPELLVYALTTLLNNAVAYGNDHSTVTVSAKQRKSGLAISVRDTGSGIAEDKLPLLFQPFAKAEGAIQFNHEGMGFSLYLDRLIMLYQGGDISLKSKVGEGTEVTVLIPNA